MDSDKLNDEIRKAEDEDREKSRVIGMENSGKIFPYIGWFWREVNFDRLLPLAECEGDIGDDKGFVGIIVNNKWGYDEWETTEEQRGEIKALFEKAVAAHNQDGYQALFDYVQTCAA